MYFGPLVTTNPLHRITTHPDVRCKYHRNISFASKEWKYPQILGLGILRSQDARPHRHSHHLSSLPFRPSCARDILRGNVLHLVWVLRGGLSVFLPKPSATLFEVPLTPTWCAHEKEPFLAACPSYDVNVWRDNHDYSQLPRGLALLSGVRIRGGVVVM